MRLFAGIPVTGEAGAELVEVLARFKGSGWPVKWVRPEGLHLTVKFLGEVQAAGLEALCAALAGSTGGTGPLHFSCAGVGAFPTMERPRILWAGLEAEPALELLVDRVERACAGLGFPIEGHPHRPHVTLGRIRDGERLPPDARTRLEGMAVAGNFTADGLVLFQSHPGTGGSRFEPLRTFPFGT
jgi:2'-5' RNA ligase